MSAFFSTDTVTLQKHIASVTNADLLRLLHAPPVWYTITERLPLLGGLISTSTTFRFKYKKIEDGCECEVLAGLGTRLTSSMFGYAADDDGKGEREGGVCMRSGWL